MSNLPVYNIAYSSKELQVQLSTSGINLTLGQIRLLGKKLEVPKLNGAYTFSNQHLLAILQLYNKRFEFFELTKEERLVEVLELLRKVGNTGLTREDAPFWLRPSIAKYVMQLRRLKYKIKTILCPFTKCGRYVISEEGA